MEGYLDISHLCVWPISLAFLTGILSTLILQKLLQMALNFLGWEGIDSSDYKSCREDITSIKDATFQIDRNWIEMRNLITSIHDDQGNFANHLQTELQASNEMFCKNIIVCLEEEFLRSNRQFSKIERTVDVLQEDNQFVKDILQKLERMATVEVCEDKKSQKKEMTDNWVQTEHTSKRRSREGHSKREKSNEKEVSKLVTVVKKCLTDLLKDTKLQLSVDREEENRELQIIFSRFEEDREEIKKTIFHAFSIAAEQTQKNFDSFGQFGQDVMHYMAVQNENTNKIIKTKLEETESRLKEILKTLNRQISDVMTIRKLLENVDGQFDDIFQEVKIRCQQNTEHCEDMAQNLEKTSNDWIGMISIFEEMAKDFASNTKMMKNMLEEVKNAIESVTQNDNQSNRIVNCDNNDIMQYDAVANTATRDVLALSKTHRNLIFMYNMIQDCSEKLMCLNNRVQKSNEEICQLVQILGHKLQSLNQTVEKLNENIRDINDKNFVGGIICAKCHDVSSEEIEHFLENSMKDVGDCQPEMSKSTRTIFTDKNLAENANLIDKEVKMIEIILRKFYDKVRNNSFNNAQATQKVKGVFSRAEPQSKNAEGKTKENPVHQMVTQDNAEANPNVDSTKMHQ